MKIDLLASESFSGSQPHEQFDWLRENAPIHWYQQSEDVGVWVLTRYKDIFEVNRDYEKYTSTEGVVYHEHTDRFKGDEATEDAETSSMMLAMDPPQHTEYRKLLSKGLTRNTVLEYEPRIRQHAINIVDNIVKKGECNFVSEVAGEMAGRVIADLMGLPLEDSAELYRFTEIFHSPPGYLGVELMEERIERMDRYTRKIMSAKRANPGDDLSSKLLLGQVNGSCLGDEDFFQQFILMINGGTDTARNVISLGLYALLQHKEQYYWLMEDLEARLPSAREELLRWITPVIYQCRTAREDTVLNRQQIKAGQMLAMYFAAANRDPAKFDRPHELDLSRTENKHMAFGGGHHICIGQWVARVEIDAMLKEVLTRLHNIEIVSEPVWLGSNFVFGVSDLHIRFDS